MFICSICQSGAELDDVVLTLSSGGCICLRCYCRETDSTHRMPDTLWQAIDAALADATVSPAQRSPRPTTAAIDQYADWFPRDWMPWWQALEGNV